MAAPTQNKWQLGIDKATTLLKNVPWDKVQGALGAGATAGATASAPPEIKSQTVYTPEMLDRYLNSMGQYMNMQNQFYGTPYAGPGSTSVNQSRQMSDQEVKAEAYVNYLISKGYTRENAQKKANQIIADKKLTFKQDKGFKKYINEGNAPGVKVEGGKIQAAPKFTEGGIQTGDEAMRSAFGNLSQQALGGASQLMPALTADVQRALQARQQLQGSIGSLLGQGFTQTGLTPQEQASYDAMKAKYMQDYGDLYRDTMQRTTGELVDSGFASSNLAAGALQRGAYDAQSRFLTGAMSDLASKENELINSRFARQSQNLNNLLNTYGSLGATQGLGSILPGVMSPGQAGLMTDPQTIEALMAMQQNQARNRQVDQTMMNTALGTPLQILPGAGGGGAGGQDGVNWMGGASGAIGGAQLGAKIGSVFPGAGTAIGAGLGGVIGGIKGLFG
jgi:hypothetical protein